MAQLENETLTPNCENDEMMGTTTTDFVDDWEEPIESTPITNSCMLIT